MSDEFYQELVDKFLFKVKKGLFYTEDDVWIKIEEGNARFGVSDFLQRRSGDVTFVDLPIKGGAVSRGEEFFGFETIKAVVAMASPFNGVVAEVNNALGENPELINQDPYGEAWIALIYLSNPEEDKRHLLTAEQYFELMKSKIKDEQKSKKQ